MDETFDEYVRTRGDGLLRFAYAICGDRHLAEDLVQEVLSRVCRGWPRFARVDRPDAYLRTAVVRQFLSWRRRAARREVSVPALAEPAGDQPDPVVRRAVRDEMWQLLGRLPRRQRAVLVLRYYEDLPDARIAEIVGCRPATVRSHAHRGLTSLREWLQPASNPSPMTMPSPMTRSAS